MNAHLSYTFSRKTFDLFNILKSSAPNLKLFFSTPNNFFLKILLRLIYPGVQFIDDQELDKLSSSFILFPQEVAQISEINKSKRSFNCIFPSQHLVELCNQKDYFYKFCETNNIKHPKTFFVDQKIENQTSIILKPKIGQGSRGIKIIKDFVGNLSIPEGYLAQQYLGNSNEIIGFFAFCINGQVINSYQHKRIITYPKRGGVTVFSEINSDATVNKLAADIIEKLNFSGLIMVEFKEFLNDFYVIEINPRLWGSILLCLHKKNNLLFAYLKALKYPYQDENTDHKNSIVWLFPYGIFNAKIYKYISNSYLLNISKTSKLRSLLFSIILAIYKLLNKNENNSI
jgi:predicted ATP-grasp superfamily ATP-dependent carboligase